VSDPSGFENLFEGRPETIHIEGFGDVPVHYTDGDDEPLPPVGPADVFAVSPSVGWAVLDTEVVVYHAGSSTSHVLDQVAALLWQCIDGASTLREIFSDIADAFGQNLDDIVGDLATVVAEWKRDGLVAATGTPVQQAVVEPATETVSGQWRHLVDPPNN
jgi:hypothetical protein